MTEDEVARWHHRLDGHEFEKALVSGKEAAVLVWVWGRQSGFNLLFRII